MADKLETEITVSSSRTAFHLHKGITLPAHVPPEIVEELQSFQFRRDDILIVTSPKSGTHWATETTGLILADGIFENVKRDTIKNHLEFAVLNRDAFDESIPLTFFYHALKDMPSPRVMYSHLPTELLPPDVFEAGAKIIYIARNPKDVLASLYRFIGQTPEAQSMTWEMMLANIFSNQFFFGPWDRHVLSYWKLREKKNVLFMKYEDMKKNPKDSVTKIAQFIGHEISDDVRDMIVKKTSLGSLKKEMARLENESDDGYMFGKAYGKFSFYQKGVIGDWKNYFTVAQNEAFDEEMNNRLAETGLTFDYE